ncbi:MAG: DUF4345 family protein [Pseudomonadota bacterium]
MFEILNTIGAWATLGMGLFGLFLPNRAADFVGLKPVSNAGRSEFRATYGGLWLPLGAVPLLSGAPLAFAIAGLCWLGAAVGRVLSIILDKAFDAKNVGGVVFETAFAMLLLLGAPGTVFMTILTQ